MPIALYVLVATAACLAVFTACMVLLQGQRSLPPRLRRSRLPQGGRELILMLTIMVILLAGVPAAWVRIT
jgi:hypothetical protein